MVKEQQQLKEPNNANREESFAEEAVEINAPLQGIPTFFYPWIIYGLEYKFLGMRNIECMKKKQGYV